VVGRLGSGVCVSASFRIFALTAGKMSWVRREFVRAGKRPGEMSEDENVHGEMSYTSSSIHRPQSVGSMLGDSA